MTRTWLAALLLSSLAGVAPARAEGPRPTPPAAPKASKRFGKIPFRVVKLLPATEQVLIYDKDQRKHLVVQVGDPLGTFEVVAVDDEELVLLRDGRELVLLVDPSAPMPRAFLVPAPHAPRSAASAGPGPLDPYGSVPTVPVPTAAPPTVTAQPMAPLDPYATGGPAPAPTRAAAPLDPYATAPTAPPVGPVPLDPYALPRAASTDAGPGLHEVLAPPAQRASLGVSEVVDPYAEPKVVAAPIGAKPVTGVPAPTSEAARAVEIRAEVLPLARAELQAAVANFDKLAKELAFERTGRGVRLGQVPVTSYAYKLGLRSGDVISAIDGAPLRGLDDAAAAYVRLGTATQLSLDVERGAARGTLRFTLR